MTEKMLNFRKLRQDFSPNILKEGRSLYDNSTVVTAKITEFCSDSIRINGQVIGNYENRYECEIEIDRHESETIDANCDCPYNYDCQHLAAILYHFEEHLEEILLAFSKVSDIDKKEELDEKEKAQLKETIRSAEANVAKKRDKKYEGEVLSEYILAASALSCSPFLLPDEKILETAAELAVIFSQQSEHTPDHYNNPEIQLALRLPYRSKPLYIPNVREFLDAVHYREPLYIGSKRYLFSPHSFQEEGGSIIKMIIEHARYPDTKGEKNLRVAQIETEAFGTLLSRTQDFALLKATATGKLSKGDQPIPMPCLYCGSLEQPLYFSKQGVDLRFELEKLEEPGAKLFLKPTLVINSNVISLEEGRIFECAKPGVIIQNTYYRFHHLIKRKHLKNLEVLRDITIPEPLFGTFIENSLPELMRYAQVANREVISKFVTMPFAGKLEAVCDIEYLDGNLEATLHFIYDGIRIPAASSKLNYASIDAFITKQGILARNLTEERAILQDLFQDFLYSEEQGVYVAKTEKKIVEFMTETIPANQHRVTFNCPENLLQQFVYDHSTFKLKFRTSKQIDQYEVELCVEGHLKGVTLDLLWECIASKKAYIELTEDKRRGKQKVQKLPKILVLDLEKLSPVIQFFDEIGLARLDNHVEVRPLWSLVSINEELFKKLPIEFSMSKELKVLQDQILGKSIIPTSPLPREVKAKLREYQKEGVEWLERLRMMYLNGILADDMGLGKTLQAITAITHFHKENPDSVAIVVCPTSLTYNWKEEFSKFNPLLKILLVDGTPNQRKKLIQKATQNQVVITSYSLLQKDIETYQKIPFGYVILDEAQHIKNRGTRNAKSVKQLNGRHRLILTGTPIENSLDELWSLFDFLMPGLLSSYERFVEKYIRNQPSDEGSNMDHLRRKVSPFILRRMKKDVLKELPPVSEIIYYCNLSDKQAELYKSYAASACEELSKLVKQEGFDKIQIHVLATLTRLKQICCHPALFAKEIPEEEDSAKYEMLLELLTSLIDGGHKTVVFSQYTRMLQIMRKDLEQRGIKFAYLDGTSKNRLEIVKQFNEDSSISVFLVSLKAGGAGLNLVGADTVIHYDMWWNPAVENQATDRVHRIGQERNVSSFKLVTKGTIEEKILALQNRKRGLVTSVINSDDEALAKLTWDEVLELLQT